MWPWEVSRLLWLHSEVRTLCSLKSHGSSHSAIAKGINWIWATFPCVSKMLLLWRHSPAQKPPMTTHCLLNKLPNILAWLLTPYIVCSNPPEYTWNRKSPKGTPQSLLTVTCITMWWAPPPTLTTFTNISISIYEPQLKSLFIESYAYLGLGKTRDLFKKIRDIKGTFHAKMGSIKDRNGMDLTEA